VILVQRYGVLEDEDEDGGKDEAAVAREVEDKSASRMRKSGRRAERAAR
jgi:hypothetical protein